MQNRIETLVPGRRPIELVSFYEELRDYYPYCELETKEWFVRNVQPEWWVFDVGANIGYYSILFAQLAARGRVLSFEPTSTAGMLRKNLEHQKISNVEIHEVALGNRTGLQNDTVFRIWGSNEDAKPYPFYRLDDFVRERKPDRIDCIKIDVDSFDFEVLQGAEQTLLQHDPVVVVELNHCLTKRNQTPNEALAWLAERGYRQALVLDYDNFVLRRERHPSLQAGTRSLELVFKPPNRLQETPGEAMSRNLGAAFFGPVDLTSEVSLQKDGVSGPDPSARAARPKSLWSKFVGILRRDAAEPAAGPTIESLMGQQIETSKTRWNYGLIVPLAQLPPPQPLSFLVRVEVLSGRLGIGLQSRRAKFVVGERTLEAMSGDQQVIMNAGDPETEAVVFRNIAPEGTRTAFRILGLDALTVPAR